MSGFISLGYQVVWFRLLTDWFGSTNLTFALVVTNFIGGLAVGSLLSGKITWLIGRSLPNATPLRIYGLAELFVAALLALTLLYNGLPIASWGTFDYQLVEGLWVHGWGHAIAQLLVALACIFLPCLMMGVTFPLLCHAFRDHPQGARFPSALYASNTAGACLGILVCQFVLLTLLGHQQTLWLLIGVNLLLGAYFLFASDDRTLGSWSPQKSVDRASMLTGSTGVRAAPWLLVLAAVSGVLAGALEGDLFKRISFVVELNPGATMSFISFWAVLAIVLASTAVHHLPRLGSTHVKIALLVALAYSQLTWSFIDPLMDFVEANVAPSPMPAAITLEGALNLIFPGNLLQLFCFTGILVAVPYFCVSLMLPYVCNRIQQDGGHLGVAYGINSAAFCAGLIVFTLIAPIPSIFYSLKVFPLIFGAVAVGSFLVTFQHPLSAWRLGPLALVILAVAALTPRSFDPDFFRPETQPARLPIRAMKSNAAFTTFVVKDAEVSRLYFGRLSMSSNNHASQVYMRLMAHFPLLANPHPEKALLICFGAGNTAAAIATYDSVSRLDIVDLNDKVFETAPEFAASNGNVIGDPRVRLFHDDGRAFLAQSTERYDLITSEPPPPLASGVYRLYSIEYYADVLKHLTPQGMMTQWLPLHLLPPEAVAMIISTFTAAFPHVFVFTGFGTDFILVGSRAPIDLGNVERRFLSSAAARHDLQRIGIDAPVELIGRIVQVDGGLRARYGHARVISDLRNDLEQLLPRPANRPVLAYDPHEVLQYAHQFDLAGFEDLRAMVQHLGRLRYRVKGFPFETLATVRAKDNPDIALAGADWLELAAIFRDGLGASASGAEDQVEVMLERMLSVEGEQPEVLKALAEIRIHQRRYAEAEGLLRRFIRLEPGEWAAHNLLGRALMRDGSTAGAIAEYNEAIRLSPDALSPRYLLAWLLATHPDPKWRDPAQALALAKRAAELSSGTDLQVQRTLAAAYASSGQFQPAITLIESAIVQAEGQRDLAAASLRADQAAYRNRVAPIDSSLADARRR
ncbi:MAG: tetratricopeptide repeat protein [Gammaproteobacteria bacterium]